MNIDRTEILPNGAVLRHRAYEGVLRVVESSEIVQPVQPDQMVHTDTIPQSGLAPEMARV
jgi:hypothetical protein